MTDLDVLVGMGFPVEKVKIALKKTNNSGLQPAMDWLVNNPGDVETQEESKSEPAEDSKEEDIEQTANSLICEDCNKLLRNSDVAQLHASKTGHVNFKQSTQVIAPLTEEEKKAKLEELKEKLALKRQEKQIQEQQEQKERERMRRITGKEIVEAKQKQAEIEMKAEFERKKKEKLEDQRAKEKIRLQIEEDKRARLQKAEEQKKLREGLAADANKVVEKVLPITTKDYKETRIQIRRQNGVPITQSFQADSNLSVIYDFLEKFHGLPKGTYTLSTSFPRKTFGDADFNSTLRDLQLVPSCVLVLNQ